MTTGNLTDTNSVSLASTLSGDITAGTSALFFSTGITETAALPAISSAITIDGQGNVLVGTSAAPAFTVANGGALALAGITISGAAGGAITLSSGSSLTFEAPASPNNTALSYINGVISGAGTVTVGATSDNSNGPAVVFNSANNYTGATTIYDELDLAGNGSIASSTSVTVGAGTTIADGILNIAAAQSSTGGAVTESVNNLTGGGKVYLGDNTLLVNITATTAATDMFAGVIADSTGSFATGGSLTVAAGVNIFDLTDNSLTYTGGTYINSGTLELGPSVTSIGSSNVSLHGAGATFEISDSAGVSIHELTGIAGTFVDLNGYNLTVTENVMTASFSGVIGGAAGASSGGGLTVAGPDELYLAGVNTYTGITTINSSGILGIQGTGSIAASSSVADNGTFDISAAASGSPVTIGGLSGANGKITLGANTLIVLGQNNSSVNDVISGVNGTLQVGTPGNAGSASTLTLTGVNTYTGSTNIDGELILSGSGSIAQSSNVSLHAIGAAFDISGTAAGAAINELTGIAGTFVDLGGQTLTVTENVKTATYSGVIGETSVTSQSAAAGNLILNASATGPTYELYLAGANVYTGSTTINAGATLGLQAQGVVGTGGVVDNGALDLTKAVSTNAGYQTESLGELTGSGTINLGGNFITVTTGSDFTGGIAGSGGVTVGGTVLLTGADTYMGATTISNSATLTVAGLASSSIVDGPTASATLIVGTGVGGAVTLAGVISGDGNLTVYEGTDSSLEILTLTGADTYSGTTTIQADATLLIGAGGSIGGSVTTTVAGGTGSAGTFDISGATSPVTIGELTNAGTVNLGSVSNTLIVTGGNSTSSGAITGAGTLQVGTASTAADTPILTVTGAETYTGSTNIDGGLTIGTGGSIANSSNVSLHVNGAFFDISTTTAGAAIHELTGIAGTFVDVGTKTLTVTEDVRMASFSGAIQGADHGTTSGAGNLILAASSTGPTYQLTLAGMNDYSGTTTINAGATLGLLGANTIASSSSVTDNGTLNLLAAQGVNDLGGSGALNLGAFTLTDTVGTGTDSSVSTSNFTTTFSGVISGAGALVVDGFVFNNSGSDAPAGASNFTTLLTLSHANPTFTGGITITGGAVSIAAAGAAGTGAITFTDGSSTGASGVGANNAGMLVIANAALSNAGTASESFGNTIIGFTNSDVIDLPGLAFETISGLPNSVVASTNQVVITEGNVSVTLALSGITSSTPFSVYEDSHGGTFLVESASVSYTSHFHP